MPDTFLKHKNKKWDRKNFVGTELFGKTLGLIGLGRIGTEVAKRMSAFKMKVIAYDPFAKSEFAKNNGIELKSLDDVFSQADYISIHFPLNDTTKDMINADTIRIVKEIEEVVADFFTKGLIRNAVNAPK